MPRGASGSWSASAVVSTVRAFHTSPTMARRRSAAVASRASEGQHLVGVDGPLGEFVDGGTWRLLDQMLLGEAAGVQAGAATGDVATVAGEGLEHPVEG